MAFDASWVAGVAVVSILGWIGFGGRHDRFRGRKAGRADAPVCTSAATPEPTGNAAFDAYRADVLKRLEDEQKSFVAFLDRLRAARDQSELDSFLADRMRGGPAQPSDDAAPRSGLY